VGRGCVYAHYRRVICRHRSIVVAAAASSSSYAIIIIIIIIIIIMAIVALIHVQYRRNMVIKSPLSCAYRRR